RRSAQKFTTKTRRHEENHSDFLVSWEGLPPLNEKGRGTSNEAKSAKNHHEDPKSRNNQIIFFVPSRLRG
ncbi:MAG: hypothetical protein ACLFV1_08260, partial [Thiohalophilus sp.]